MREILILHRLRRLGHRGLHQTLAAALRRRAHARQLHDAEQLIAQPRKGPAQQPRGIFEPALPPDPAMPLQRKPQPQRGGASDQQQEPQPAGVSITAVQHEYRQIRKADAEQRRREFLPRASPPTPGGENRRAWFRELEAGWYSRYGFSGLNDRKTKCVPERSNREWTQSNANRWRG